MIGDQRDTESIAGMGAGLHTVLVLAGITRDEDISTHLSDWIRSIAQQPSFLHQAVNPSAVSIVG